MNKEIKLSIKNKQLADGLNLDKLKSKLINKKGKEEPAEERKPARKKVPVKKVLPKEEVEHKEPAALNNEPEPPAKETPKAPPVEEKPVVKAKEKEPTPIQAEVKVKPPAPKEKPPKQYGLREDRPIRIKRSSRQEIEAKEKEEKLQKKVKVKPVAEKLPEKEVPVQTNSKKPLKPKNFKDFQDLPPLKKSSQPSTFDSRSRHGLVNFDEGSWKRKRRPRQKNKSQFDEDTTIRPSTLKVRIPISIKNLAAQMKLKSSQLITYLFKQGMALTLNDFLDDETTIQLLGQEFTCQIEIDTDEQDRVQITDKSLAEEINLSDASELKMRPPVVTFMGHVDHGKTSLIDSIRKSNRVASEAGDITQHIGAFQCKTSHGLITILDTPGHEAFSAMRTRGADVTDIVVLVVAGDEGIKDQTIEALKQAKDAKVTIIVAINKSDKENFNPDPIYRELADHELIPEQWGGSTITINCSAKTGAGVPDLLELIALQSEVLELKANPNYRARGTVLESEIHKGLGNVATLIVQNGSLNIGDAVVFGRHYAKIKTMINDHGKTVQHAPPSMPIEITGMSGLPEAGNEFIVVSSEKEAKQISEIRALEYQEGQLARRKTRFRENFLENTEDQIVKKVLHIILRTDVQGSLEALKHSLEKINSAKIDLNIISEGVGEVTESDIQLAKTSGACIIGFHTRIESHAEEMMKRVNVLIKMPKVIYEAVDIVKELMVNTLDLVPQENDKSKIEVKAIFKASKIGKIAGCTVLSGNIQRSHKARLLREGKVIWKGAISSLKREKEDVKEVKKGMECGIVLANWTDLQEGDIIESFEVTYHKQTL